MFFERPASGEAAVLVHLHSLQENDREDPREFEELALSAGADPLCLVEASARRPDPRHLVGGGKLEEILARVREHGAELVLFNHALSPGQERNLERALQCRVLDRTGLILDIFAQRARTHEGKLQVELAQLEHMSTRLVRGWTHLERQKGGIGLRGPGETQLETDRRLLRARIKSIHRRLEKVRRQRAQGRRSRQRSETPTVSLVGYTNAGKSTLFNALTDSGVYAADQLFATLDPTLRRLPLADVGDTVLADTVGFIRHLPHKLVEAFRATLQETRDADLLVHVVDASAPERRQNIEEVLAVLDEIGAGDRPVLEVYNKIDQLDQPLPGLERDEAGRPRRVWLSARDGLGLELFSQALNELLAPEMVHQWLSLEPSQGAIRAGLYRLGAVLEEEVTAEGHLHLEVRVARRDLMRLLGRQGQQAVGM